MNFIYSREVYFPLFGDDNEDIMKKKSKQLIIQRQIRRFNSIKKNLKEMCKKDNFGNNNEIIDNKVGLESIDFIKRAVDSTQSLVSPESLSAVLSSSIDFNLMDDDNSTDLFDNIGEDFKECMLQNSSSNCFVDTLMFKTI